MAYNKSNRTYRKREYDPTELETNEFKRSGTPVRKEPTDQSAYHKKTIKGLQIGNSITPKADPSKQAAEASSPYQLLTDNNRIIDRGYKGTVNLSGNVLTRLLNDENSRMLNIFDAAKLKLQLKYLYMAMDATDKNQAVNGQMLKTYNEAISKGYAESFTNLPLFSYTVTSSIPVIGATPLALFTAYQTYLQNVALVVNAYNLMLAMEKHLKGMSFNREETQLNSLFGLLKKAALRSRFNALATITYGEYFDVDWAKTANSILMIPSRRSNGMKTPIQFINGSHDVPVVRGELSAVEVFDSSEWENASMLSLLETLTPYNIIRWARQYANGDTTDTANDYYNTIVGYLDTLLTGVDTFKGQVTELRTVLDVMTRVGLNNWRRGVNLSTTNVSDYQPVYNKLVADIYSSLYGSSWNLMWDTTTQRWKFFSLWDRYYGIPEYEKMSGGAFILFSTRSLPTGTTTEYKSFKYMVPILFDNLGVEVKILNRLGDEFTVSKKLLNNADVEASSVYCRLNPLELDTLQINLPAVGASTTVSEYKSALIDVISEMFGLGLITKTGTISDGTFYEVIHPDKLCFIDTEVDDVSNDMITFCQAYGPFRIAKPKMDMLSIANGS